MMKFLMFITIMLLLAMPLCLLSDTISEAAYEKFKVGEELVGKGNYEEAVGYFKAALDINPGAAVIKEWLGFCYINLGRYQEAIDTYMSVHSTKLSADSLANLGFAYYNLGNNASAIAYLTKAVDKDPQHKFALNNLGLAYIANRDPREAEPVLRKAVELYPDFYEAWNNLGIALKLKGEFEEALECYDKAKSLNPKVAETYYNIAVIYKVKGNNKLAGDNFAAYLRLGGKDTAKVKEAVNFLRDMGRLGEVPKELRYE